MKSVRNSSSSLRDEVQALEELALTLVKKDIAATYILFLSHHYRPEKLSAHIQRIFGNQVIACTSAGEIASQGYQKGGMVGMAFDRQDYLCHTLCLEATDQPDTIFISQQVQKILSEHRQQKPQGRSFALFFADGLSTKEEVLTEVLSGILGEIPLVGGSAADGLDFHQTLTYCDGKFSSGKAVLAIFSTELEFNVFIGHHFSPTQTRFVITKADPATRTVYEIDGYPASKFYAMTVGVPEDQLGSEIFSLNPVMLKIGQESYIRSIQKVNPDQSITFYCAIDEGIILYMAKKNDFYQATKELLEKSQLTLNSTDSTCLLFECILRRLEVEKQTPKDQKKLMSLYQDFNSIGFHTYGEQLNGIHHNQTLTGVFFGQQKKER